jgi:hypothetical protein
MLRTYTKQSVDRTHILLSFLFSSLHLYRGLSNYSAHIFCTVRLRHFQLVTGLSLLRLIPGNTARSIKTTNTENTVLANSCSELNSFPLTSWSRVLLEKLVVTQLVKKFSAFYGTQGSLPRSQKFANSKALCNIS